MSLRTAEEYKQGIRDDRVVYILGQRVPDVTEDPYIKVGVETGAREFLLAEDPGLRELAVTQDPETGDDISRYFELPDYKEQIRKRLELVLAGGRYNKCELTIIIVY